MTRPIDETWRIDSDGMIVAGEGDDTEWLHWEKNRDSEAYLARARLAAQAPAMARMLLRMRDGEPCCERVPGPVPSGAYTYNMTAEHAADCALIAVLRDAGVVEP